MDLCKTTKGLSYFIVKKYCHKSKPAKRRKLRIIRKKLDEIIKNCIDQVFSPKYDDSIYVNLRSVLDIVIISPISQNQKYLDMVVPRFINILGTKIRNKYYKELRELFIDDVQRIIVDFLFLFES